METEEEKTVFPTTAPELASEGHKTLWRCLFVCAQYEELKSKNRRRKSHYNHKPNIRFRPDLDVAWTVLFLAQLILLQLHSDTDTEGFLFDPMAALIWGSTTFHLIFHAI